MRLFLLCMVPLWMYAQSVEQLFNVQSVTLSMHESAVESRCFGYVAADESRRRDVVMRYEGYVEELYADRRYARVKKGEALAKVYSPDVYRAKEEYLNALRYDRRHGDAKMLASALLKLQLLGVDEAEIGALKNSDPPDTRFTTITAPTSGYLYLKALEHGSAFKAGQKLFEIVDLSHVWIEAKIDELKLKSFMEAAMYTVESDALGRYSAHTPFRYPVRSPGDALVTVRLEADNPGTALLPGAYVRIFASAQTQRVLRIPKTAVIRKNGTWYAFAAGEYEGEYEPVEVKVKVLDSDYYAVESGLNTGDKVVNNAMFMMDSDAQINGLY